VGDQIIVTVSKWADFNYRKDITAPSWFRFAHKFFEDAQFYDFTHSEICAWLYILCQASKESSGEILINLKHLEIVGRIKLRVFKSALQKLERNGIVTTKLGAVTSACSTEQNKTEQDRTILSPRAKPSDFDSVYRLYPRNEGKTKGLEYLAKNHCVDDLPNLEAAASNYSSHCRRERTEKKYIKLFSTWVRDWPDWLDESAGKIKYNKPKTPPLDLPNPEYRPDPKPLPIDLQNKLDALKNGKAVGI